MFQIITDIKHCRRLSARLQNVLADTITVRTLALNLLRLNVLFIVIATTSIVSAQDPETDMIRQHMPEKVAVKRTYRVLCYSKPWGYPHASIGIGRKMMQVMADETGLFEVVLTDDLDEFSAGKLERYDAICLNNTTHLQKGFTDAAMRSRLIDFVLNGGGLVAIHSATDGGWPEYTEMIGGNFNGHPWGHDGTWTIAVEDPTHALMKGSFSDSRFDIRDELYQYKDFDREKVRVLLSVDMSRFRNHKDGRKREDEDYALAWVKQFGKGRVFVSSLGHNKEVFYNPSVLKMWFEGFRFVLGETDADTTSRVKPKEFHLKTDRAQDAEVAFRTPEQSLRETELQDGYQLELVAGDDLVSEPTLCVWDGNGRMYVAEFQTYMQDIDGNGTDEKVSQVVRLEDTNDDGIMDRRVVFAKGMMLPRMILPLDDRVLIGETNSNDIYAYRDTNNDGVADEKTPWYEGGKRGGNLEHQPSGLIWAMDNRIYTTYNEYRFRFTDGAVVKEKIRGNRGQWGLTQDNHGKVIFMDAGAGIGPVHTLFPHVYTNWHPKWSVEEGFRTVYPIDSIYDAQGGWGGMRPDGTIKSFTATCGQSIFRGDRLPAEMQGNMFFGEPVARMVRRATLDVDKEGRQVWRNAYPQKEFIRSTDANFRPVNSVTGPDGTLYIVDMHRGIIQEGAWVPKGSFIRKAIEWYGLDKNIGRGRIYRLRHGAYEPGSRPNMLNETSLQLTEHLSHPNGWWRDEAQKLIVLRGDRSVIARLKEIVKSEESPPGRLHALWTLEGLGAIDLDYLDVPFADSAPGLRAAAIRISERYFHDDIRHVERLRQFIKDPHHDVSIQLLLSLSTRVCPETREIAEALLG